MKNLQNDIEAVRESLAAFKAEVSDILFDTWDPIGFNSYPDFPKNEYARYAPVLVQMAAKGCTETEMASRLEKLAETQMALETSPDKNLATSRQILEARERHPLITLTSIFREQALQTQITNQ